MSYNINTTLLGVTNKIVIGYESIEKVDIHLEPEMLIYKDKNVTKRIFGLAYTWEDISIPRIVYQTTNDLDVDYLTPKASKFNSTDIVYNLNMNFIERQYVLDFFTFGDIMSKLGGYRASFMPIFGYFSPLFVLLFLL